MLNGFKKARLIAGCDQKQLAEKLGVSPVTICKWETGRAYPRASRLAEIASALDTTVEKLLEHEGRVT